MADLLPSPLFIVDANYGGKKVKNQVTSLVTWKDWTPNHLQLDTGVPALNISLGGDPLINVKKTLSILYHYGDALPRENARIFITSEGSGTEEITPHSRPGTPLPVFVSLPPKDGTFDILAIVYGAKMVTSKEVYDGVYSALAGGSSYAVSDKSMGGDTFPGWKKSAVVYFQDRKTKAINSIAALEGGSLAF